MTSNLALMVIIRKVLSIVWLIAVLSWVLIGNEQQRTFLSGSSTRPNQLARVHD